jgi:hypothetical protein
MMTMLVATLGLLPAALSHTIGSDSRRPFAIVIVGGLIADLIMSIFLLPTLYVWIARESDVLPEPQSEWDKEYRARCARSTFNPGPQSLLERWQPSTLRLEANGKSKSSGWR